MLDKLKAIYAVFTVGQSVANPANWKRGQITAAMLASLMGAALSLAKMFGIALPLSDADLLQLGGAVITVYGVCSSGVTVASTDKIGLPALKDRPGEPELPAVAATVQPELQRDRRARNGDAITDTPADRI